MMSIGATGRSGGELCESSRRPVPGYSAFDDAEDHPRDRTGLRLAPAPRGTDWSDTSSSPNLPRGIIGTRPQRVEQSHIAQRVHRLPETAMPIRHQFASLSEFAQCL